MKKCPKCKETKELGDFYKNRLNRDGLCVWCKACQLVSVNKWSSSEHGKNKRRNAKTIRLYGITVDRQREMLKEQGGLCANPGCYNAAKDVDHDHETGVVRGILCKQCNMSLGLLKDDQKRIEGLVIYLQRNC